MIYVRIKYSLINKDTQQSYKIFFKFKQICFYFFLEVDNPIIYRICDKIKKFWNYESQQDYLERVRVVFLFCCFTFLRYSDVALQKMDNIINNTIQFVSQKTKDFLTIELNKYSNCDKVLPVISKQKYNNYLKELAQLCGIDTLVTLLCNLTLPSPKKRRKKAMTLFNK